MTISPAVNYLFHPLNMVALYHVVRISKVKYTFCPGRSSYPVQEPRPGAMKVETSKALD